MTRGPIAEVEDHYDVAIIDLPYNVFTHASMDEQAEILKHARRIADQAVVVAIDTPDNVMEEAGFEIIDRCVAKTNFLTAHYFMQVNRASSMND